MTSREELAAQLEVLARDAATHDEARTCREAAQLIRESAPLARPFANAVAAEIARARTEFPGNSHQLAALVEGVGEVARALIEGEETVDVLMGCVRVAAMAQRIAEDGDDDFPDPAPDRVAEGRRAPYDKAYGEALGVEPASTGVREDDEARVHAAADCVTTWAAAIGTDELIDAVQVLMEALEPAPTTLKGEDE